MSSASPSRRRCIPRIMNIIIAMQTSMKTNPISGNGMNHVSFHHMLPSCGCMHDKRAKRKGIDSNQPEMRTNPGLAHSTAGRIAPMRRPSDVAPAMPLLRLLGVNCAAGMAIALLAVGGLLALDDQLRGLIFSDHSPAVALALLGGGFVVTFAGVV